MDKQLAGALEDSSGTSSGDMVVVIVLAHVQGSTDT